MEDQIIEILMLSKFTKRGDLRQQLIARGFYINDRKLRHVVEKMITEEHYLISSSEKGYSLITSEADLNEAMTYLRAKASSIAVRANCILRNWKEKNENSQIALFV